MRSWLLVALLPPGLSATATTPECLYIALCVLRESKRTHQPRRRREGKVSYSQSVEVYLDADVAVGRGYHTRDDVVVVPAAEVLVLEKRAVVHLGVEACSERSVEHSAGATTTKKASETCYFYNIPGMCELPVLL